MRSSFHFTAHRLSIMIPTLICLTTAVLALVGSKATAEPMSFTIGATPQRCGDPGCGGWISAIGEITSTTPLEFEKFLKKHPFRLAAIRFTSPGGDLFSGLQLGQQIRKEGLNTEAEVCASACAYAFLGGVKRSFVTSQTVFGVHRFYRKKAALNPTLRQFSGADLDDTQKVMAGLMLYATEMDVDLRILAVASEAGAEEMRWISEKEAQELKVIHDPGRWLPWKISPYLGGIIAYSETDGGERYMQISCSKMQGGSFTLIDRTADIEWLKQCVSMERHPILGLTVTQASVRTGRNGFPIVNFFFGKTKPTFDNASVFNNTSLYPMACISPFDGYAGTTEGLRVAGTLALKNCIE